MEDNSNKSQRSFHIVDTGKCFDCKTFDCEEACFRGIYKVENKDSAPKCIVVKDRESFCVICHMCTTACKQGAIEII